MQGTWNKQKVVKIKVPSLKENFGSEIIERGEKYFNQHRVKSVVIDGDSVAAVVIGSRNYRVRINLKTGTFKCTCLCEFNCKHVVAVILALRDKKQPMRKDEIDILLKDKSKEELVDMVKKMLISEPKLKRAIRNSVQNLKERIENLEVNDEEEIDDFVDEVDQLYEESIKSSQSLDCLVALFKKCFSFYSEYGSIDPLEESMFIVLERISKEAKELPKDERKALLQKLIDLTREYDFFWDSIDDKGLKLKY
ncbi:MAG TPA: SWIM zinc finger family protein [Candidatus Nanoarchaeia archaeon]|nr:SWIM zinc finger family protein [Candidatus Nanoarchaeia archaeon]